VAFQHLFMVLLPAPPSGDLYYQFAFMTKAGCMWHVLEMQLHTGAY